MGADTVTTCALYEGKVFHQHPGVTERGFTYRIAMPLVDLDELSELETLAPLWRDERRAPITFRRSDFLGDPAISLASAVREVVERHTGFRPDGPIRLLAHHRTWGWVFNPIALYYCFALDGETLQAVVADVTNTPWGESHAYVIDTRNGVANIGEQAKLLHVSPFLPMDLTYQFTLCAPEKYCDFAVTVLRDTEVVFRAVLSLQRRPLDRRALARVLVLYPFLTLRVSLAIYTRAVRLWLRRATVFPHPRSSS